jgi:hypothetical protein
MRMAYFSMNHLAIQILEFVRGTPAHKLPVIFTLAECPLPDCAEPPDEVFLEVARLLKVGLIEALVIRDVKSNPKGIEVRYVTIAGVIYLEENGSKRQRISPLGRV